MNIGIFEDGGYRELYPLTWLRAACELRCGRDRLCDKLRTHVGPLAGLWLRDEVTAVVSERLPLVKPDPHADWLLLNARLLVREPFTAPAVGSIWCNDGTLLAARVSAETAAELRSETFRDAAALATWMQNFKRVPPPTTLQVVAHPWQLTLWNAEELRRECTDRGVHHGQVYAGAHLLNAGEIHIAEGAVVMPGVVLDAEHGPIYIAGGARIEPNAVLEGPCAIGAGTVIRPHAAIRAGTSIGPVCKVGGEVEASIIHGHSNKQHDGFLGHSYVGEWVNLGADTVTSDLKNTYGAIRVFINGQGIETGERFVGAIIGDHTKTGIGTLLPTGCVIGAASNVFTHHAVPKFVPSFAWLTDDGMSPYRVDKAIQIARVVMGRRDVELTPALARLLEQTATLARDVERTGWA